MKNYENYIKSLENHNAMLVEFKNKALELVNMMLNQPPYPFGREMDMLDELKELGNILSAYEKPESESDKQLRSAILNEDAARKRQDESRYILKSHTKHYPK